MSNGRTRRLAGLARDNKNHHGTSWLLQAAAIAVKARLKKADFDATVALHPTMAEELVLMR